MLNEETMLRALARDDEVRRPALLVLGGARPAIFPITQFMLSSTSTHLFFLIRSLCRVAALRPSPIVLKQARLSVIVGWSELFCHVRSTACRALIV